MRTWQGAETMPALFPLADVIAELERGLPPRSDSGFLGARLDSREAALVLIPVPWEATTSYGGGTSEGPAAIVRASHQLDLEDSAFGAPYRAGIETGAQETRVAARRQAALELRDHVGKRQQRGHRLSALPGAQRAPRAPRRGSAPPHR